MKFEFVELYKHCQYKWFLKYGMEVDEDQYNYNNPEILKDLLLDTLEFGITEASQRYYDKFPIINNEHIEEVIKVQNLTDKMEYIPDIVKFRFEDVDMLVKNVDNSYTLYEVVYNKKYKPTGKLSVLRYKLYEDFNIKHLKTLHFPYLELDKYPLESIEGYRSRLRFSLGMYFMKSYDIEYNHVAVANYLETVEDIENNPGDELLKNNGFHCYQCEYRRICKRG